MSLIEGFSSGNQGLSQGTPASFNDGVVGLRAKNEAGKIIEGATKRLNSSREKALTTAAALRDSIAVPRRRVDATTTIVDGEVRARLATLPADARRDILREAIRVGDEQIVGAALAGPAMLSGFADRAEREEFRLQWQTAHCAAELSRIERIEKAVLDVERAGGLMIGFLVSLTDEQVITRAEESERRAQEILAQG